MRLSSKKLDRFGNNELNLWSVYPLIFVLSLDLVLFNVYGTFETYTSNHCKKNCHTLTNVPFIHLLQSVCLQTHKVSLVYDLCETKRLSTISHYIYFIIKKTPTKQ